MAGNKALRSGFTLIELLVAISVLAIVAVLGWRGLDGIVRARLALNEQLDATRGLQLAFAQLQSDCEQVATPDNLGNMRTVQIDPNRLLLIRMVYTENQPSRAEVIVYRVSSGVLTRQQTAPTRIVKNLDTAWKAALDDHDLPGSSPVVLQRNVASMTLQSWYRNSNGWRTDNGDPNAGVPIGLQMELQINGQGGNMTKTFLMGAV